MKQTGIKKLYYSISEVSKITGIEQYVLRYWETEFDQLKPQKNRAGNRIYTNRDIKLILCIMKLLREERYTIGGAKQVMENYLPDHDNVDQLELIPSSRSAHHLVTKETDSRLHRDLIEMKKFLEELSLKLT